MKDGFVVPDLIMQQICLPASVPQRHDRLISGEGVVRTSYWERISDMAADYRSAAHMYQGAYRALHESLVFNESSHDVDEEKFLVEIELKNQLRLSSHQFLVHLYHLLERVTKCCCECLAVGLGTKTVGESLQALRLRISGLTLPDKHPFAKEEKVLKYGEMLRVVERLRYLCNDIKHDGFVSKMASNNVPGLKSSFGQVVPDLTDVLIDDGLVKDAVFFINALVGLMSDDPDECYIQI